MGLSRVTLILFLLAFSPVFSSGGRRKTSLPFSSLLKNGGKKRTKASSHWITGRVMKTLIFFHQNITSSEGEKSIASKKEHWWNLTALNFNMWLGPGKGGETCCVNTESSLLQPVLPCLLWGQIPLQSLTLPQPKAVTSPPVTGLQCGAEGAGLPQPLVYIVIWVISFSSFPGALIKRGGSLVRAVPWAPGERWACLELLCGQFHGMSIFK